jgi:ribosome biogenesis protein YTM1
MMAKAYSQNEDAEGEQIRVSFVLAPGVNDPELEIPSDPIAVPSSIRRKGLSAIINHLLGRRVKSEDNKSDEDDDSDDDDDDDDDEEMLPAIPFDFLLNNKLLRLGVEAASRREGLSLEQAVEIKYFPAQRPPEGSGESETFPDWITSMSLIENQNNGQGVLCTGGADGTIRIFGTTAEDSETGNGLQTIQTTKAHSGTIQCISTAQIENSGNRLFIASGSMDQTVLTHTLSKDEKQLALHAVYTGGHFGSISSTAFSKEHGHNEDILMASGDWNGGLCIWRVPTANNDEDVNNADNIPKKKKKKLKSQIYAAPVDGSSVKEVGPMFAMKAHSSNISGIVWDYASSTSESNESKVVTGSWDHSIKVWDINRQESLLTLNGSKVVTSLGRCHNSDVVATGHPDCSVRLWDMRTSRSTNASSSVSDSTLKPSHRSWVSDVKWSQTDPFVLASTSHDGTIKMWDIRSSQPLYTVRSHPKGEKGLCLAFGNNSIFSGGSDCVVKVFKI